MQTALPAQTSPRAIWRNWGYFLSLIPGVLTVFGNLTGGIWTLSNLVFSMGILALLEPILPRLKANTYHDDAVPAAVLWLHVVAPILTLGTLMYGIHTGLLQGWVLVYAILSTGVHSGASSTVVAHELCHRRENHWKWASKWLFLTTGNIYFYVAHLRVHHRLVGTAEDTTTARFGETSFAFVLRSAFGQIRDAFRYEAQRLEKEGKPRYGLMNYPVGMLTGMLLLSGGFFFLVGPLALVAYIGQVLVANFLLELTNYIEHYGLTRKKIERVGPLHAWDSDHITRFLLVELTRHSDHHMNGALHYHKLKHQPASPKLPTGYAGMVVLSMLPPMYFALMNPRVRRVQQLQAQA